MIINALTKYYEILTEDEKSGIPLYGYSSAPVGFALNISSEGELLDVIPLKVESQNSKKLAPRILTVPERQNLSNRTGNIYANFICDNSKYVFGVASKGNPKRSKEAFLAFKELHNQVLVSANGQAAKAILAFLDKWNVNEARQHSVLQGLLEEILEGSNLVFRLDGETGYIHNDLEIKRLWEEYNLKAVDDKIGQCLITGENTSIAKLHPNIKKVKNAQSSGASLVSFNAQAYESYGKMQSYNSPISKYAAFAYTTVLNHMLSSQKQRIQIGDATTVFWAESPSDIYPNLAMQLFNPTISEETDKITKDIKIERLISDVLKSAKAGGDIPTSIYNEINPQTKFYVLGLSPNASRISIRFFHFDSFGGFIEKTAQHYADMEIVKDFDTRSDNIPIWQLLRETISPNSSDKEAQPLIAGAIMRSILSGGMYPQSLYNSILQRVKTDIEIRVNYIRASIIKAFLIRKSRITKSDNFKEVLTVALNDQSTEKSYLLGRLFAILEKTQKDAGNETIRARYFASAMTTPGAVFPILLKLAQHHISKAEFGFLNDKKIESILDNIESFPSYLTLDEQGVFILGYYQQRPKLWEKQTKENENLKEEN